MTINDYITKKIPEHRQTRFKKVWNIIDPNQETESFIKNLKNEPYISISGRIQLIGELEIKEYDIEKKLIDYARELISSEDFYDWRNSKAFRFECIFWTLASIGTEESIKYIEEEAINMIIEKFNSIGNFNHIISACQLTYLTLSKDKAKTKDFFDKTMPFRDLHLPEDEDEVRHYKEFYGNYGLYMEYLYLNYGK